jgi:hypothetical protein
MKKGGVQVFSFPALAVGICIVQDAVGSGLTAVWPGSKSVLYRTAGGKPVCGFLSFHGADHVYESALIHHLKSM